MTLRAKRPKRAVCGVRHAKSALPPSVDAVRLPEPSNHPSVLGQEPESASFRSEQLPSIAKSKHAVELARYNLRQALEALRAAERALEQAEVTAVMARSMMDTTPPERLPARRLAQEPPTDDR